jgi:single-stranded-DNA-specific exonuclease
MAADLAMRWVVKKVDEDSVARQGKQLNVSPLLARILASRGLTDAGAARSYLSSSLRTDLPAPFIMADMEPAVERIVGAIKNREQIGIWGDYDVDGTTGASVLVSFLREIGVAPLYHVPHRIEEGYGLNFDGLMELKERGVGLVITVDCGISNANEVAAARKVGLDIVIVDHHQPPEQLPAAAAVINPHRKDCGFPDRGSAPRVWLFTWSSVCAPGYGKRVGLRNPQTPTFVVISISSPWAPSPIWCRSKG